MAKKKTGPQIFQPPFCCWIRDGEQISDSGIWDEHHGSATSVADPDTNSDPPDPHVFGPPPISQRHGSGSISQRYGFGSGSFYHHAKIVRKTLIPTIL
jgi:hypothetical protein